ncbi:MAG: metallophosphoesterase [Chloroflexota bacterium]|nr:metallophosphoesterase [Chloroflexota bacterium]
MSSRATAISIAVGALIIAATVVAVVTVRHGIVAETSRPSEPSGISAPSTSSRPSDASAGDPVLLAAGDIADCDSTGDDATAALLDGVEGTVLALGDLAYPSGTAGDFANCYAPTWGRHAARTRPVPGNHDYETQGAAGYFGYFGAAAGDPSQGWYSYDLGAWHVVALNSLCAAVGGCGPGSPQEQWLRADLAAHPAPCTLAYWHHPRFSSAQHGSDATYDAFWQALYEAHADVVLVGHDHVYERFAAQSPGGAADAGGIRQFTVGTGGRSHYEFGAPIANSELRDNTTYGVLELTLRASGYEWEFVSVAGGTFTDVGSASCSPL